MELGSGGGAFKVEGLNELRRALGALANTDALAEFRLALKDAAEIVAVEARLRANTFSFRAADTIKSGTSGARAYVKGGKNTLPWYGWADFGSRTPRTGQPRSVGPWANSGAGPSRGRFIYPAFDFTEDRVADRVARGLDQAKRRLGF